MVDQGGFLKLGIPFWGSHNKDCNIFGSILLGYPELGKLPNGQLSGQCVVAPRAKQGEWQHQSKELSYIRIMENKMETTTVYWGYIGIMENKMETTIVYWGSFSLLHSCLRLLLAVQRGLLEAWRHTRVLFAPAVAHDPQVTG